MHPKNRYGRTYNVFAYLFTLFIVCTIAVCNYCLYNYSLHSYSLNNVGASSSPRQQQEEEELPNIPETQDYSRASPEVTQDVRRIPETPPEPAPEPGPLPGPVPNPVPPPVPSPPPPSPSPPEPEEDRRPKDQKMEVDETEEKVTSESNSTEASNNSTLLLSTVQAALGKFTKPSGSPTKAEEQVVLSASQLQEVLSQALSQSQWYIHTSTLYELVIFWIICNFIYSL